jgi:hypothetical protein
MATPQYGKFVERFVSPEAFPDVRRRCLENIIFMHGHRAPWTQGLLEATLYYAGFDHIGVCTPGHSDHPELVGVEGHGRVIGDEFNQIETVVVEATKQGDR